MTHERIHNKAGKRRNPKAWEASHKRSATYKRQQRAKQKSKAAQLIAQGPGGGDEEEEERRPIPISGSGGRIPLEYQSEGGAGPRYFEGADYVPAAWKPQQVWKMQQLLIRAGFLRGGEKGKMFRPGFWDDTTRLAYREVLEAANAAGVEEREVIQRGLETPAFEIDEQGRMIRLGAEERRKRKKRRVAPESVQARAAKVKRIYSKYLVPLSDEAAMQKARRWESSRNQEYDTMQEEYVEPEEVAFGP